MPISSGKKLNFTIVFSLVALLAVSVAVNKFYKWEEPIDNEVAISNESDNEEIVPPIDATDEAERFLQMASQNFFYHEFTKAAENYRQAILTFESQNKPEKAARTYESIGDLYKFANERDSAEENYLLAAKYHERIENPIGQARAFKLLGDMYMEREQFESAGGWYKKALGSVDQAPPHMVKAGVLEALGQYYWKTGNVPEAINIYTRAREAYSALNYEMGYINIVKILEALRKEKKAGKWS
jgi:tetratricopeptide (TPR) repeat protein